MFKRNQISAAILAGTLLLGTAVAVAQEETTVTASVAVQNAFNLAQSQALSFGTLRVTQVISTGLTSGASVTVNADGTASTVTAGVGGADDSSTISVIEEGLPAIFTIDSAAPNTAMTISEIDSIELTANGSTSVFELNFTLTDDVQVVGGPNDGDAYSGFNLITDATGAVSFNLGGTLSTGTTDGDDEDYIDTTYSGDYTVEVSY